MHSGKKPQSILVKSDDFENSFSLLYILLKSCLCSARSLRSLRSNKSISFLSSEASRKLVWSYNDLTILRASSGPPKRASFVLKAYGHELSLVTLASGLP